MKNKVNIIIILLIAASCSQDVKQPDHSVPVKDSVILKQAAHSTIKQEQVIETKSAIDYTGTYKLYTNRFREFVIRHRIELIQTFDSIKGIYVVKYSDLTGKIIASFKTGVIGQMTQSAGNINSYSTLTLTIQEQTIDSAGLKSNHGAQYMIDKFIGSFLVTRFSVEENTLENNYAGGEWDTWTRIK